MEACEFRDEYSRFRQRGGVDQPEHEEGEADGADTRVARWLADRTTATREAWKAMVFVLACWVARAVGLFFLLAALGVSVSFPLALAFLVAAAASSALPIAPAGAATQAGAGAALLVASGIGTSQAIAFAVAAQAILIAVAAVVLVVAAVWGTAQRFRPARVAA